MIRPVISSLCIVLATGLNTGWPQDQKPAKQEASITNRLPKVGSAMPTLEIYDEFGSAFSTSQLQGQYTVLVFGCLT